MLNSHRDDRRRRALAEDWAGETTSAAATVTPAAKPSGKQDRYTAAARRENHRRTSDFVPRSNLAHALWWLAGLTLAAGLLAGYATLIEPAEAPAATVAGPLFQLAHGGSLIGWFSSTLLTLAAAGSVLTYSIRRHRLDDYRGSYRLWLWSAAAWLVMSIDATANLHTPFSDAMTAATGWSMAGNSAVWWIGVWGMLMLVLAIRLGIETRDCRSAMVGVIATFSLWTAALAIDACWIAAGEHAGLIAAAGRLVGQMTLLLSIGLYARHVLLDAEGLLPVRAEKPKREKKPKKEKPSRDEDDSGEPTGKTSKIDSAHKSADKRTDLQPHAPVAQSSKSGPLASRVAASSHSSANASISPNRSAIDDEEDDRPSSQRNREYDEEEDDDYSGEGNRKMSRAERKRLRKMQKQQRDDQ